VDGRRVADREIVLEPELRVRDSTGAPRRASMS
jgi:hypothetical protein